MRSTELSLRRPLWVSIDGVECAGKSTVVKLLREAISDIHVLPEFSGSVIGLHLRQQVTGAPHFIDHSPVGQSLLFLADHADLAADAKMALGKGTFSIALQDRGYLSKFVYQYLVLSAGLDGDSAGGLVRAVMSGIAAPDVTVLLDADIDTILARFAADGRKFLSHDDEVFLRGAVDLFRSELWALDGLQGTARLHIAQKSSDRPDEIASRIVQYLDSLTG